MRKWCTLKQATKLMPGQVVHTLVNGKMVRCEVIHPMGALLPSWRGEFVCVRRLGRTVDGSKYPEMTRSYYEISLDGFGKDPVRPNIFADWLDDHGFPDAAQALREAFPLIPLEE